MDLLTTLNKFWLLILEQNNVLTLFRVRKKTLIRRQTKVQPTLLLLHVIKVFNSLQHKFSVDTVITDLKQSKTFSILDFCGGSWLRLQRLPTILEPDQRYTKKKVSIIIIFICYVVTLSWRRSLSHRNQLIDLLSKSMDWFLYDRDFHHERIKMITVLMFWMGCARFR